MYTFLTNDYSKADSYVASKEDTINLYTELPGVKKEDITITIEEGRYLIVIAKRDKPEGMSASEYFSTKFRKVWDANGYTEKDIEATFVDGLLSLKLSKNEIDKAKKITIK